MATTSESANSTIDAPALLGRADVLFVTLDTLRYDVAEEAHREGETPFLSELLGPEGWERRHSPASFTYAAHQAFFAGFLPTPARPGRHERLFATRFLGSETSGPRTLVFDAPDIVTGFREAGYRTICIGGVGFFNRLTPLGRVLPGLFAESHWEEHFAVTERDSTRHQVEHALERLRSLEENERVFLFLNVSALHQPNYHYLPGATDDSPSSQRAALRYVDRELAPLVEALRTRAPTLAILTSDHGTAYGEAGYEGHRLGHEVVWTVPFAERLLVPC